MTSAGVRRNPYIIGRPISEKERFFGRESLFHFLEDSLIQGEQVILLHGQRRIGKSSVLSQIPHSVECDGFKFVPFDLQDQSSLPLSAILENLATEIVDYLELEDSVTKPTSQDLEVDSNLFTDRFLPNVYHALGGQNLVLLLDEFDVLGSEIINSADKHFFSYLKLLIDEQEKLFIIPVVGRKLDDMQQLLALFRRAPTHEIGLLDEASAKRLILNPAKGILEYDQNAIRAILELSAGHPYFTQAICFALFGEARNEGNWKVTRTEVEKVVDKAIESAQGGLAWFWDGLPIPEQVVFSAVAEAQESPKRVPEEPLTLLQQYGVIPTKELKQAAKQLIEKDSLDETGRKVKVELVRRWLVRRYPLRQEIWQLEKLDEDAHRFYLAAAMFEHDDENKRQKLRKAYEQVLEFNPNYFSALFAIADISLTVEDFSQAVELYTRSYKVDSIRNQEKLVQSLLKYGTELCKNQQQLKQAKQQFERALKIDPNNATAQDKLSELKTLIAQDDRTDNKNRRIFVAAIAASVVAGIPLLIGIGYDLGVNSCPPDQQRIDGVCESVLPPQPFYVPEWDAKRFSRGERTLFPYSFNHKRDLGIEAFQNRNYLKAADFFEQAVAKNRNDPEVLIYYNNALAREQGSPLTLAVVVPASKDTSSAYEMLRGVAQAQNQLNISGGLNSRLLEIVIANDDNEPDKSKKVVQELVKDPSVLGVIGHTSSNSSNASRKGLAEYEKAGLAIISPNSASIFWQGGTFFRTVPSDEVIGRKFAEYSRNILGLEKLVIFYNPESLYSNSLRDAFEDSFEKLGGRVVQKIDLSSSTIDFASEVPRSIFQYQAEAGLLFPNKALTSQAIDVARVNAELIANSANLDRHGLKLLGGDTLYSNTTLNEGGEAVEGLILAVPWFRGASGAQEFSQTARQLWGGDVSWRTAMSYDATQAFIQTLFGNPDRTKVLQRLREVTLPSSETSGEVLQFTPDGERVSEPILVKVVDGEFKLVEEEQKEPDSP